MEINPDDIIQLIFFSALFLMVIAAPKILLLLAWFLISCKIYTSKGPFISKIIGAQIGESGVKTVHEKTDENLLYLTDRTLKGLKDPIIESTASIVIILMTVNYLSLGPSSSGIVLGIIVLLIFSIVAGILSFAWISLKQRGYMHKVFAK